MLRGVPGSKGRTWTGAPLVATFAAASLAAALLVHLPADAEPADQPPEWFRSPVSKSVFRVVRDRATGRKTLVGPDGREFDGVRALVEAETLALPPLARTLHQDLLAAALDPERSTELVDVTIVFRRQPLHDAGQAARERHGASIDADLDESRRILDRIAPLRTLVDGRPPDLGTVMAEEDRLLTADEKARLRALSARIAATLADLRREAMTEAASAVREDQADVASFLDRLEGAVDFGGSVGLNARSARVPAAALRALAEDFDEIDRISPLGREEATLNTAIATAGANTWWTQGWNGSSSTIVGVMDTGIDTTHPAFSGVMNGSAVFHATASQQSNYADNSSTDDLHSHGTHVGGIVASVDATYRGVAYGGRLLNVKSGAKTTTGGTMYGSDGRQGADWAISNGATALNYSFGSAGDSSGTHEMSLYFDAVVQGLGVIVAQGAGNDGPSASTIAGSAGSFNTFVAGSLDDNGTATHSDNFISSFSSRGPTTDGRRKPDLCSPGGGIMSANYAWEGSAADFVSFSGTSMASPMTAGAVAILQDYGAASTGPGFRALLLGTTKHSSPYATTPGNTWGYGAIDLGAAYSYRASVREGTLTASGPQFALLRGAALASGARVTLCWNRHVVKNGASIPSVYYSPLDLDLYVYDESSGASLGSSTSSIENCEQVAVSAASSAPIVKVYRYGSFPSGFSTEGYAVATESAGSTTIATQPVPTCVFTQMPPLVGGAATFTVQVQVSNPGTVVARSPQATLTLPSGFSVVSGANPATLANLSAGANASVSWTVSAPTGPSGTKDFSAAATSTGYGETFAGGSTNASTLLDVDAPSAPSVVVEDGATYTNSTQVTLGLSANDAHSGVGQMRVRAAGEAWGEWTNYATSLSFTLSGAEGTKTVEAQFVDRAGNVSSTASDSIVLDSTPPSGALSIDSGAAFTKDASVSLAVSASDSVSGVTQMRFGADGETWGAWQFFVSTTNWSLATGADGPRTVWIQFADAAGNVSGPASDSIDLDSTAPQGAVSVLAGAAATNATDVTVDLVWSDALSGVEFARLSNDGQQWSAWFPAGPTAEWTLLPGDGVRTVHAQFRDAAGNASATATDAILLDVTPPTGSFRIDRDVGYLLPWEAILAETTATDPKNGSGVSAFRASFDDGETWGVWTPILPSAVVPVERPDGVADELATASGQFRDAAGNVSAVATAQTFLVGGDSPSLVDVSIVDGFVGIGGDHDAFRIGLLEGDRLDLVLRSIVPNVRRTDFDVEIDLIAPDRRRVVTGRYPYYLARSAVKAYYAQATGEHWVVVRAVGGQSHVGGRYVMSVKRSAPKSATLHAGKLAAGASPSFVEFEAVDGARLTASLSGVAAAPTLVTPDGTALVVPTTPITKGRTKIAAFPLTGGTGTYRLEIPAVVDATVVYRITLAGGKRKKLASQ
jgi:subtilisin family serine protease